MLSRWVGCGEGGIRSEFGIQNQKDALFGIGTPVNTLPEVQNVHVYFNTD